MANVSVLIWQFRPDLNWAGFYRLVGSELVLVPFQGKAACIRIPLGKGVCGTAAQERVTQCVTDVRAFPGHIACDAASRSEIVVPVVHDQRLLGVRSEEHTSELQSLMRISYAVFCLKKKKKDKTEHTYTTINITHTTRNLS